MHRGKAPSQSGASGRETEEGCCSTSVKGMVVSVCSYERYTFPLTIFHGISWYCPYMLACSALPKPPLGDEFHVMIDGGAVGRYWQCMEDLVDPGATWRR
jgi:hypothetical protein